MPGGKLSPGERVELRLLIRDRVTAGEKREIVARELAARYGVSPAAISWHIRRELSPYRRNVARSGARRGDRDTPLSSFGPSVRLEELRAEFDRLLERDLEIRKAHARNLASIRDLSGRASDILSRRPKSLAPLGPRPSRLAPGLQSFGSRLRELRLSRGTTLEEVARGAQTNKGYLSWIERGRFRPPSGRFVSRIARFFSVDEGELLRLAYLDKAPPLIKAELIRAFWPAQARPGRKRNP